MKIRLITRAGEFVHDAEIPPFDPPPEVILWGQRVFVYSSSGRLPDERVTYVEGLLWHLFDRAVVGGAS